MIGYSWAEGLMKRLSPTQGLGATIAALLAEEAPQPVCYEDSEYQSNVGWENSHYEQARVQQRRKALHKFHEQKRKKAKQCRRKKR